MIILNNIDVKCGNSITIYIYMSSLKKKLPIIKNKALSQEHVNTAYTTSCPLEGEIIVFRKEEWFKVFIHETFHTFCLDFSDMNNGICHLKILELFGVKSQVNLFEAYTEFWAELINICFYSYYNVKNMDKYLELSIFLLNCEKAMTIFQAVKILDYMGLRYKDLYTGYGKSIYKEKSNVLSYFILEMILVYNYPEFLLWCVKNNSEEHFIKFKKSEINQNNFCNFIEEKYKSKKMISDIVNMEYFLENFKYFSLKKGEYFKNKRINYILNSLRMSICDFE